MKALRVILRLSLFLITLSSELCLAEVDVCRACDLIEKEGNECIGELQKMSHNELSKKDRNGATPFYWSLFHGYDLIRDFLLKNLKKEDLLANEKGPELFEVCANQSNCSTQNLELLYSLGFKTSKKSLINSVAGTQECSLEKFKLLKNLSDDFSYKTENGFNLLHQIVDRSRAGRPILARDCLTSAIKILSNDIPQLKTERDKDGYTPFQLAMHYRKHKDKWGSGIKKKDIDSIIKALRY